MRVFLALALALLVVGCGSTPESEVEPAPRQEAAAEQTDRQVDLSTPEKVVYEGPQMECTVVGDQQAAPAELASILSVKENDWVSGPETAAVTIVEYSDFQ